MINQEKKAPKVTVLMPVYNGEKYLRKAIESILNQTFKDFEFLIINDGSSDDSVKIIEEYGKNDSRIRLVHNETNMNLVPSLNRGLELAQGEYIARMDCDDISLPKRLEKQVAFMDKNADIAVCGSWIRMFDKANDVVRYPERHDNIKCSLLFYNALAHPSVIMRRSFLNKFQVRYERILAEDYDIWQRLSFIGKLHNIPEILLNYRISSTSYSQLNTDKVGKVLNDLTAVNLSRLNIDVNDESIDMHKHIGQRLVFNNIEDLEKARKHLNAIYKANHKMAIYPEKELRQQIDELWFHICTCSTLNIKNKIKMLILSHGGKSSFLNKRFYVLVFEYAKNFVSNYINAFVRITLSIIRRYK